MRGGRAARECARCRHTAQPIGARWEARWYLRNRLIANAIVRATRPGDRVLVLYGAGYGNWLRQNAAESGLYRMHDPVQWLTPGKRPPARCHGMIGPCAAC